MIPASQRSLLYQPGPRTDVPAEGLDTQLLRQWNKVVAKYSAKKFLGGQSFVETPYIVRRHTGSFPIKILVATVEGLKWYDKIEFTEAPACQALGMIHEGDTVFDCGANHGVHSIVYSKIVGE